MLVEFESSVGIKDEMELGEELFWVFPDLGVENVFENLLS